MRCLRLPLALPAILLNLAALTALTAAVVRADEPGTGKGTLKEASVGAKTRIDWRFAVSATFGPKAATLPDDYDSTKQRYQLFVPKNYDGKKAWPLVVFISPGDKAGAWRFWEKVCTQMGMLYCEAYGAGNGCPVGKRTRIVLDMLDDVRRNYKIDPDQTYLAGFSGGGRMSCSLAFSLPEYFGGVLPICGTNPWSDRTYLRQRVRDRLSVAFVTGTTDFNRKENEDLRAPFFKDVGVRTKLWVVRDMGHAIPGPAVLAEAHKWLAADLPRRRADAKARPRLAMAADEAPSAEQQAARLLETAETEVKKAARTWHAAALAQGVVERWPKSASADSAKKFLAQLQANPDQAKLLAEQRSAEESLEKSSEAKALERFGLRGKALRAWRELAEKHPDSTAGKKAVAEIKRLETAIAAAPKRPYLGVSFQGNSLKIGQVEKDSPADKAGLQRDDLLTKLGDAKLDSFATLTKTLARHKPGDKVAVELDRNGSRMAVQLKLGARSAPGDE